MTCALGLLCAEVNVGNLEKCTSKNSGAPGRRTRRRKSQKMYFPEFWDSRAQNKTSEISKNALSGILGLLGAEQDVGNLKKCTFRASGTPVRRTRRRKSQKMHFQGFWDSCAQNKTSEISKKMTFQDFWDSSSQNKTSEISLNTLSGIMGLLDHRSWIWDPGSRILDAGYPGSRIS